MYRRINELIGTEFSNNAEIDWIKLSKTHKLSEEFMEEFSGFLSWSVISDYQSLSEPFIEKHWRKVVWNRISGSQTLSEDFIRRHIGWLDPTLISEHQTLSEEFIDRHSDILDWDFISGCQVLSTDFMMSHKDLINKEWLANYRVITPEMFSEMKDTFFCYDHILSKLLHGNQPFLGELLKDYYEEDPEDFLSDDSDNNLRKEYQKGLDHVIFYVYMNLFTGEVYESDLDICEVGIRGGYYPGLGIRKVIIKWEDLEFTDIPRIYKGCNVIRDVKPI